MDKMEEWEIQELYQLIQFSDVNDWERTRWLLYAIVQVNSKKKIKMEESNAVFTLEHQGEIYQVSWTLANLIIDRL